MKSSSLKIAKISGINSPRCYRDALIHEWFIPEEYKQHVSMRDRIILTSLLKQNIVNGEIFIQGKTFSIIWISGPRLVSNSRFAILSIRWSELLSCGYVLVKAYQDKEDPKKYIQQLTSEDLR